MRRRGGLSIGAADALGYAGLIPFFATALGLWFAPAELRGACLLGLTGYAAAILSFLGGARWGIEAGRPGAPRPGVLAASTAPSLAAWTLVLLALKLGPAWRLAGFALCFGVQAAWDLASAAVPTWYRNLRFGLTVGAEAALLIGLAWALKAHAGVS